MANNWTFNRERPIPSAAQVAEAERLTALGYRRRSNKYRILSRIDREDWVYEMAVKLRRAPADFYVPGALNPCGGWCSFYRGMYSEDNIEGVEEAVFRQIPGCGHDPVGFIELTPDDLAFVSKIKRKYKR